MGIYYRSITKKRREMTKLCIKEFVLDGLVFTSGISYEVQYNNVLNKFAIYNPHGYTFIDKSLIDKHFV